MTASAPVSEVLVPVAFDTETALITDVILAPQLVCTTWAVNTPARAEGIFKWDGEGCAALGTHGDPVATIAGWFTHAMPIGHNTAFDTVVLVNAYPALISIIFDAYERGVVRDTGIRDKLLNNALGKFRWDRRPNGDTKRVNYFLSDCADRWLGYKLAKGEDTWRLRYIELHGVPLGQWPRAAIDYAISDARATVDIHEGQERFRRDFFRHHGLDPLINEADQCRAAFALQLTGAWGMRVMPHKIGELAAKLQEESDEIRTILTMEAIDEVEASHADCEHDGCVVCAMLAEIATADLDEPLIRIEHYKAGPKKGEIKKYTKNVEAARARMLAVCGWAALADGTYAPIDPNEYQPLKWTGGGKGKPSVSLDKEACEDSDDPILQGFAEYTKIGGVLNKDVPSMLVGEIHGNFDPLVATGRTSCRGSGVGKKKGMQLQNPSRKAGVRECFGPRDGTDFCFIDLDTAELRAFAQVCINLGIPSRMAQALNAGADPHVILASSLMRISYEEALRRHNEGDPEVTAKRQTAKSANFGFLGGMGWKKFRTYVKAATGKLISEEEAKFLRAVWLQTWPEAKLYFDYISHVTRTSCTIVQHYSGRIRAGGNFSELANTLFQGLIADAIKAAMWRLCRLMYDPTQRSVLFGSRIVNMVHDEFITEVPKAIGHECAQEIQRVVLAETGRYLPDVPPRATPYLSRTWCKRAKPVYDETGRLIPWHIEMLKPAA